MSDVVVREATPRDVPAIHRIHNHEIVHSTANWDAEPRPLVEREAWFAARQRDGHAVLVADRGGEILGYAAYGPFRDGAGYARTMEHSVYVDAGARRLGIGAMLLGALVEAARARGVHALIGGLSGDNEASLHLHQAFGFATVGRLPEVGVKFGRWLDLVFVELRLDAAETP